MNTNRNNSHEAIALTLTSDSHTAVETPITLPRPHSNGDEKLTGSPPNQGAAKKRWRQILAAAAALIVALAAGVYYFRFVLPYESTDNAFIEGNVIPMASQVPGRVAELLVKDNQAVKQGDVILKIDPRDYEASLAQARADLAAAGSRVDQAKAQVNASEAKVAQAQAAVVAADAENQRAADDLKRYESVDSSAVSRSAFDAAQSQARAASANLEAARSQAKAAEAEVALSAAGVETASAAVQQAEAKLRQAELNLSYTQVTAPEDGRVTRRVVEQGAYIQPGQSLMAIVPRHYWVIANFKEIQLTHMRVGQPVEVEVDAYPESQIQGPRGEHSKRCRRSLQPVPAGECHRQLHQGGAARAGKNCSGRSARKRPRAWPRHVRGSQSAREIITITLPKNHLLPATYEWRFEPA